MMKRLLALLLCILLGGSELWAAIPAGAIWEITASPASCGSNVCGGFFNYANANFIADFTTDANTANTASPVLSSATYSFVAADDEAWVYISAGTNWYTGRFCRIDSVASNKATLSAAIGACVDLANRQYTASTTVGIASVGTPTSGTIGIDYSRGAAAITTTNDLATSNGTTNPCAVTSSGAPFRASMAGNGMRINSGGSYLTTGANTAYEIVSISGTTATLDKACSASASDSMGTFHVGGSLSMNSTLDDDFFELGIAGNQWFVKNGTIAIGENVSIAAGGGSQNPIIVSGYNTIRGDNPTGTNRPILTAAANTFTSGANWNWSNLRWTGTAATFWSAGAADILTNSSYLNNSTTTTRIALQTSSDVVFDNIEAISYFGTALSLSTSSGVRISNSYLHDSVNCISSAATTSVQTIINNLFIGCITNAITYTAAQTSRTVISNNTIYGASNAAASTKYGTGLNMVTGATDFWVTGNILNNLSAGITHADTQSVGYDSYNDYFGNTADVTNWTKGTTSIATSPAFSLTSISGTTATTTAGNHLVQTGATFQTSGVTAGRDYLYIVSGTGPTVGVYGIASVDSETQITTDVTLTANATGDKVWQITVGRNLATSASLPGFPGAFQGGYTTGYQTIGAVQKAAGGGGGIIGQ